MKSARTASTMQDSSRMNSLGVNAETLEKLLELMDRGSQDENEQLRRAYIRWPFACPTIQMRVEQPGGAASTIMVVGRDLSTTGMGMLHSHFVYPGTRCGVRLTDKLGVDRLVSGVVARCMHYSGVVHEIGMKFDQEIDPRDYIASDRIGHGAQLESVDPEQVHGRVLHIEDNPLDAKLLQHHLSKTRVRVTHAGSYDKGLHEAESKRHDLLLIDEMLDDGHSGSSLLSVIRESQPNIPAVALTAHDSPSIRELFENSKVNAFVTKPVNVNTLIQTISAFLTIGPGGEDVMRSTLAVDDPTMNLVPDFVDDLHQKARNLEEMFEQEKAMESYSICLQISGVAPSLGFDELAKVSTKAAASLASTMSTEESALHVRSLIDCCLQVAA